MKSLSSDDPKINRKIKKFSHFPPKIDKKFIKIIQDLKINLTDFGFHDLIAENQTLHTLKNSKITYNKYNIGNIMSRTSSSTIHEFNSNLFRNYTCLKWTETNNLMESPNYKFRNFKNLPMNYLEFQNLLVNKLYENNQQHQDDLTKKQFLLVPGLEFIENLKDLQVKCHLLGKTPPLTHPNFVKFWIDFYFKLLLSDKNSSFLINAISGKSMPGRKIRNATSDFEDASSESFTNFNLLMESSILSKKYEIIHQHYDLGLDLVIDLPNICYMLDPKHYNFVKNKVPKEHQEYSKTLNPNMKDNFVSFSNAGVREKFIDWLKSLKNLKIGFRHFPTLSHNLKNSQFGRGYLVLLECLADGDNELVEFTQLLPNESDDLATITATIINNCPYLSFDEFRDWDLWLQHYVEDSIKNYREENKHLIEFSESEEQYAVLPDEDCEAGLKLTKDLLVHYRMFNHFANINYYTINKCYDPISGRMAGPELLAEVFDSKISKVSPVELHGVS